MILFKRIKSLISKCDLFRTTQYFRYQGEPDYNTCTGGICSILIVIVFVSIFLGVISGTLNKSTIQWTYGLIQQTSQEFTVEANVEGSDKFMFAVGINNIDLNQGQRYFDIFLSQTVSINGTQQQIPLDLFPCDRSDWIQAGTNIINAFDRTNLTRALCPKKDTSFAISGTKSSSIYKYVKIQARLCNASLSSRPCVNSSVIDQYLLDNPNFNLHFYFVNTLINPANPTALSYYLQDRNYVPFNLIYGGLANIFISRYTITTDQTILPNQETHTQTGGIVNYVGQIIATKTFKTILADIYIKKSSLSMDIQRHYTKLDGTLSYIGGLFGFLMIFFVFMKFYTEYSYEIQIGDKLYKDQNMQNFESQKFNFLTFIGYAVYQALQWIGLQLDWKIMKKFAICRQQIKKQFDIGFLMKRIIFFERCLKYLFQDHQLKGLHMHDKLTVKEAQQLRSYYRLRQKLQGNSQQLSDFSENENRQQNRSSQMNVTQNIMSRHQENPFERLDNEIIQNKKASSNKVYPLDLIPRQAKHGQIDPSQRGQIVSKSKLYKQVNRSDSNVTVQRKMSTNEQLNSNSSILVNQSNSQIVKSNLNLLRKQSQSGNYLSKKIYEGVNADLLKHILAHIQQKSQRQPVQNNILVCENQNQFSIRISKRRVNPSHHQKDEEEEHQIQKIQIQTDKEQQIFSPKMSQSGKKEFQFIS